MNIQLSYAKGIVNFCVHMDASELEKAFSKLKTIVKKYEGNEKFLEVYAAGIVNTISLQECPQKAESLEILKDMAGKYINNINIQISYLFGLTNSASGKNASDLYETIDMIDNAVKGIINHSAVQEAYITALFKIQEVYLNDWTALDYGEEISIWQHIMERLEKITEKFPENEKAPAMYIAFLHNFSCRQKEAERVDTLEKVRVLVKQYAQNIPVQKLYEKIMCDSEA